MKNINQKENDWTRKKVSTKKKNRVQSYRHGERQNLNMMCIEGHTYVNYLELICGNCNNLESALMHKSSSMYQKTLERNEF